jgi:hypothetical protein
VPIPPVRGLGFLAGTASSMKVPGTSRVLTFNQPSGNRPFCDGRHSGQSHCNGMMQQPVNGIGEVPMIGHST